ncbi:tripartite tricarboxylate transporter substrate binding protein [Jiella sonneratiae]|uniref:Tripartite tricarboxylate transporter substrate binding protein n=1 Tax=Jiella sonneratiae TaxID=2816856 RepID=A0ABS3J306_9HYPH|nr:tripartite tricarboxylate transporter substrate binding protein [Jiella sonneratiae]MBO0904056.1 tripartite tricarboxylate transporter substrate binding protein [Jiella sonneratiae]
MKKIRALLALAPLAFGLMAPSARAEDAAKPDNFPTRPISLVVSYPAGGGMDITARTLAKEMERVTDNQFRVENHGGGGGIVGNTYVAKQARPDGYTVGVLANPTMFMNILKQGAEFTAKDVEPIAGINFEPVIWVVRADSEFGKMDFKGILDYAKENPGKLKVGVIPNASFDMATRIVAKQSGADFNIVPFPGGKPALVALLGGNIDMSAIYYSEVAQYIEAGQMKVLAVADNEPLAVAPDAPTMKDLGIEMASGTWGADRFAAVPKGTDPAVKAYLASLIAKTLADEETKKAFEAVGVELAPKSMDEQQTRYDESQAAVHDYLEQNGELAAGQ